MPSWLAPFLTARWHNLFLATYRVPPALLEPGLSLDLRGGSAFVSVVAFEFLDTRVANIASNLPCRDTPYRAGRITAPMTRAARVQPTTP